MRAVWTGRRQAERRICHLKGEVRVGNDQQAVDCIIYDLSPTGARIALRDKAALPGQFDLYIPSRSETKFALVRWQRGTELGVEFASTRPQENPLLSDLLSRCAALEAGLADLRGKYEAALALAENSSRQMAALQEYNSEFLHELQSALEGRPARAS